MNQFVKRKIKVIITLAQGQFSDSGSKERILENLRTSVSIQAACGDAQGQLQLQIFGLPLSTINELTTIGPIMQQRRNNRVAVYAGNEGDSNSWPMVYEGSIFAAYGDFQSAPEVVFNIMALSAAFEAVQTTKPRSYKGSVDVAVIMEELAGVMKKDFENNGVSVMLENRTFNGSPFTQVKEAAWAADIYYTIDNGKLAIWPKDKFRSGDPAKINAKNGMVGYPAFSSQGIVITSLFNPNIRLGGRVEVDSDLTVAKGIWNVYRIIHAIESETPNGQWFSQCSCYRMEALN